MTIIETLSKNVRVSKIDNLFFKICILLFEKFKSNIFKILTYRNTKKMV